MSDHRPRRWWVGLTVKQQEGDRQDRGQPKHTGRIPPQPQTRAFSRQGTCVPGWPWARPSAGLISAPKQDKSWRPSRGGTGGGQTVHRGSGRSKWQLVVLIIPTWIFLAVTFISVKISRNICSSLTSQKGSQDKLSNTEKEVENRTFVFCVQDAGINMVKRMIWRFFFLLFLVFCCLFFFFFFPSFFLFFSEDSRIFKSSLLLLRSLPVYLSFYPQSNLGIITSKIKTTSKSLWAPKAQEGNLAPGSPLSANRGGCSPV